MAESYLTVPDGCSKHPNCDTCPFDECKASSKDMNKRRSIDNKHKEIVRLKENNVPVQAIMKRVGYKDKGTVYKIIREGSVSV